jgi:outer membrane protein OmpA-like peptidoglycan-associated protein/tetratricopeptide (TPR) repeat protein
MKALVTFLSLILIGSLYFQAETAHAQQLKPGKIKKFVRKGRKAYRKGEFWKAKSYYDKVTNANSDKAVHWFETGLVYYDSQVQRENAIIYFEKALELSAQEKDTIPEIFYYAGKTYHFNGEYEKAIETYNIFLSKVKKGDKGMETRQEVVRQIEMCNNGIDLRNQEGYYVEELLNLGLNVNSEYLDYSPVVTPEDDLLLFCSRRPPGRKKNVDGLYYEDIFYSARRDSDGEWGEAEVIDKSSGYVKKEINDGKAHEAPISLSADGNTLYIYKENGIWKSTKTETGQWDIPVKMNQNVNIGSANPSMFITPNEDEMFIVSVGVKDGLGERDIYHATRNELGGWNKPVNMGPVINTQYKEDAPYLSKDGKTLYFASEGHNSMGGFDIFKTIRDEDGNWSEPINIGSPVNSAGDDIYYIENEEGTLAYYATMRPGSFGYLDIYTARYGCKNIPTTNIKGYAIFAENNLPVNGIIKVTNKDSGEEMGSFNIDPKTGKYNMVLPPDNTYILELVVAQSKYNQLRPHAEEFYIPKQCEEYNLFQQIKVDYLKDDIGSVYAQRAHFKNAMFDIDTEVENTYNVDMSKADQAPAESYIVELGYFEEETSAAFKKLMTKNDDVSIQSQVDFDGGTVYYAGPFSTEGIANTQKENLLAKGFKESAIKPVPGDSPMLDVSRGISGQFTHEGNTPAKGVEILLLNQNNQILRITETDDQGLFAFEKLDPSGNYVIVANEDDAKASMGSGLETTISGTIYTFINKENTPKPNQQVYFADNGRRIANITATNSSGSFELSNIPEKPESIAEINDNVTISYNMDISNSEVIYSAYILNIDPNNTELAYTEYIDIIELRDIAINGGTSDGELQEFANILFDFDKFFLRQKSEDVLSSLYAFMNENPSVTIRLDGYTDAIGTEQYNMGLSQKRSLSAHKYLIDKGIDPNRIQNSWFGESKPVADNQTADGEDNPAGRQLNRRVEIKVEIPEMSDLYISL